MLEDVRRRKRLCGDVGAVGDVGAAVACAREREQVGAITGGEERGARHLGPVLKVLRCVELALVADR